MNSSSGNTLAELMADRFGPNQPAPEAAVPGSDLVSSILGHRTHRTYSDKPVEEACLQLLLACAFSTPSKSDLQQCSVLVVRDAGRRRRLAELIPSMPWIALAPVFLVFCGDSRRIRRIGEARGKPFANDHLDAFLNAAADAAMHLATFITAADALGLGSCPISVLRDHIAPVTGILELPPSVFPLAGCCLGWPARDGYVSMRLPLALSVHEERYDDDKFEALLAQYDRDRDDRFAIPEASYRRIDDFGGDGFYGWSEDKARQVSKPERAGLGAFLRRHGFNFD